MLIYRRLCNKIIKYYYKDVEMREENKQSNALANKIDIEAEIVRDKVANLLSWFFLIYFLYCFQ